jgi:dihydroneopterin aldolase/2-amino-4-hydroxy-6-hydroxymethyldihydropteridine diphosphokinase
VAQFDQTNCLHVNGIILQATHGVLQSEKQNPQPFKIDVALYGDFSTAALSDELSQSIDYEAVVEVVKKVMMGPPINLIETLCYKIGQQVSDLAAGAANWIKEVEVVVTKLKPPVKDLKEVSFSSKTLVKRKAYLGIGSNLGDRWAAIRFAVNNLPDLYRVSSVYETTPVGGPPQENYLNLVAELITERHPNELLAIANDLEAKAGRVRDVRWGPRVLDIDILKVGELRLHTSQLIVPHPRMWERRFVLVPLAELVPDLVKEEELLNCVGEVKKVGRI